jgi:hypothetical protein
MVFLTKNYDDDALLYCRTSKVGSTQYMRLTMHACKKWSVALMTVINKLLTARPIRFGRNVTNKPIGQ